MTFCRFRVVASVLLLVACAQTRTRIIAMEGDRAQAVSTGYSESKAYDAAVTEAELYCSDRGRRFVMVKQDSEYKGMNKSAKAAVGILGAVSKKAVQTDSIDDNKVVLEFRCLKVGRPRRPASSTEEAEISEEAL
jgi:hypothetical protein